MIEPGQDFALALEPLDDFRVAQRLGRDELEEVIAVRVEMLSLVRSRVGTARQQFQDPVLRQRPARGHGRRSRTACRRRTVGRDRIGPQSGARSGVRRRTRREFQHRGRRGRAQDQVVGAATIRVEQRQLGGGQLVQHALTGRRLLAQLKRLDVRHLPVGGRLNDAGVFLKDREPQQAVMRGRLFLGRNAQPLAVRIEARRHQAVFPGWRTILGLSLYGRKGDVRRFARFHRSWSLPILRNL